MADGVWYKLDFSDYKPHDCEEIDVAFKRIGIRLISILNHALGGYYLELGRKLTGSENQSLKESLEFAGYENIELEEDV